MGDVKKRLLRGKLLVEIGAERHRGVGEAFQHVDDDQRRPLAETHLDAEAALLEELFVILAAGHLLILFNSTATRRRHGRSASVVPRNSACGYRWRLAWRSSLTARRRRCRPSASGAGSIP